MCSNIEMKVHALRSYFIVLRCDWDLFYEYKNFREVAYDYDKFSKNILWDFHL